jgi:translocation and assembly module TamB
MTESDARPERGFWKYLLLAVLAGMLALVGLVWYSTTDSFQCLARRRLIAGLEKMTGGKVELGRLQAIPLGFRIDITNLTIHGREKPGEVPYAHVDRLVAHVKVISILERELGFDSLLLDHPTVHVILYREGTTNQPQPSVTNSSAKSPVETLFSLSIGRLDVRKGELLWEDQRVPLDFVANDVAVGMSYSHFRRRFESYVILGKVDTTFKESRPFAWRAEAQFDLGRNYIDVSSLKWSSNGSHLEASGRLSDFHQPRIEGKYKGTLDLGQISSIARARELRAGLADVEGKGSWSLGQFRAEGKLRARQLDWRTPNLTVQNAELSSDFWLTDHQLRLTKMDGRLLGGSAVGDLEISNWLSSTTPPPPALMKGKKLPEEQKGLIRLRLKDISVAVLAKSLSTPARPLTEANFAGIANGSVDAHWRGSLATLEAQMALNIRPPSQSSPHELPLTAVARATYHRTAQELELSEFSVTTPSGQIRATGRLSASSSLRVSASTVSVREWQPIIAALRGPSQLAVALHGHATFNGVATGKLSQLSFAGNFQMNDFTSAIPAEAQMPAKQIRWDSITTNILFSPDRLAAHNGILRHAGTDIRFDVTAGLNERQFSDRSPFTLDLNIRNGDVREIQSLVGYSYPVTGRANLVLHAFGTRLDPRGQGRVQLIDATVYGQPFARFNSDIQFLNAGAELTNIHAVQNTAEITGTAGYQFTSQNFHFDLVGKDFELSHFHQLESSRFSVDGRMDFTIQGSGTLKQPIINAKLELHDLAFDKERVGDFTIEAVSQGPDIHVNGTSQFAASDLAVDGTVGLRNDWPAHLNLHFKHLDVDALIRIYLGNRITGHSAVAGDLKLMGPLLEPRRLNVTGNLNEFLVDVGNIKLVNAGPIRFAIADHNLNLQELHLIGDLTDLSAHGSAQLAGEHRLDLRADGHVNLKLIQTLNPDFTSGGRVTVGLNIAGSVSEPQLQGQVELADGAISYIDLPSGLSNMNGTLVFNQDRLQIETLTARTGGGSLNLGGFISYLHEVPTFDLSIRGQDVRLRYPPGVSSTANADLRLAGSMSSSTLSGDITITKLAVTPGFDFASYLERSKQSAAVPSANSLLNRLKLDVHIVTTPELQMQTALAKLTGDADLRARGTAAKPVLLGRVDILEGEVKFNGAGYRLERGDITFNNPVRIAPVLDLQASTRVSDYDITMILHGEMDKLRVNWRSEPPLPEADIVSLLALGRTRTETAALQSGASAYSPEASSQILSQALTAATTSRAQRLFGSSRIKIDPEGLGTETSINRGPQVTIDQQVYNNLTLTYSTNVSQTSQQIIQVEYSINRNISVVALRDYNGVLSFDVKLRKRKK